MILNPKIFRAYDIRGEAFVDFDEDGFYVTAHAFAEYLKQKHGFSRPKIFVSGDGRLSLPLLYPAIITGLESAGCEVVWGGVIPTPINYFAHHEGHFDAAIQISASHNPAKDNGLKLTDKEGAVAGEEIQEIRRLAECTTCRPSSEDLGICKENCRPVDYAGAYLKKIQEITPSQKPLKLVLDAGNGVAGIFYPEILKDFGHEVLELYCDLDTSFPNHQPDPERPENLKDVIQAVKDHKADYGVAYDGDGDRFGMILPSGDSLSADKILFVLAADLLSRHPKTTIVVDAMSSATLHDKIRNLGGTVVVSKTGHSFIEHAMKEHSALLGGEQSGHMMFGENFYGHDDACLGTLKFIGAVQKNPQLLSAVTTHWPQMHEYSEKMTVEDEKKFGIIEALQKELPKIYPQASTLDGVRIDYGSGEWAIIRASNTSPKIALRVEAKSKESLDQKVREILAIFNTLKEKLLQG